MKKKIIGIFGGSFNPPLYSHLSLAEQLLNDGIDKIIFVPVSTKYNKQGLEEDYHRFNMLKLACKNNDKFEVSSIEIDSKTQPYTVDTLKYFQELYPDYEIRFIIGTDNLKEVYWWHNVDFLLTNFKIIVLSRDEDSIEDIIKKDKTLSKYKNAFIKTNISIRTNLSSTYVRDLIKNGKIVKYLLPDEVIEYIYKNQLYL